MEYKQEHQQLQEYSSDSDSVSTDEVEFELPVSEMVTQSKLKFAAAATVALVAVGTLIAAPVNGKFDFLSCLAFGYIYGVFCFQNIYIEWPLVPCHIMLLLFVALAAFFAPTVLSQPQVHLPGSEAVLWDDIKVRIATWCVDVLILLAGYRYMVRGPSHAHLAKDSLKKKVVVITGCNTGIGYETARLMAEAGATIVFACRSKERAVAAMKSIVEEYKVDERQLVFVPLDTSNFASVREFPKLLEQTGLRINMLIMNAGVMLSNRALSPDGLEMTMATNHFGHFLLTLKLLPSLLAAEGRGEEPRIVIVGSNMSYMHGAFDFSELEVIPTKDEKAKQEYLERPYELFRSYGQSKLANLHFTTELARRLKAQGSKIPVNQIHPGEVLTEVMRDMHPVIVKLSSIFRPVAMAFMKTPVQGCFCTMHVATDKSCRTSDQASGQHFVRCSPAPLSRAGSDEDDAARLWQMSEVITGEAGLV